MHGGVHTRPVVVHLIDDTTAGGVMRVLDHIQTSPALAEFAHHRVVQITRGQVRLKRYKADVIVSHLSISWRTLPALMALRAANNGKKLVHVEHSYTQGFVAHNVGNRSRFHMLLKLGFGLFDRVIAVSNGQADWLERTGLCPTKKLAVIRSCVDLSGFSGLNSARPTPKVFGAIGRLDPQKGFDTLISAFRKLPQTDIELHFYGTGSEAGTLEALADGDPRIRFMGHTPDPLSAYEAVDAVVMPSRWEAYGLVAIEALCAGRTVLCSDVDGLGDHEKYGATIVHDTSVHTLSTYLNMVIEGYDFRLKHPDETTGTRAQAAFVSGWRNVLLD